MLSFTCCLPYSSCPWPLASPWSLPLQVILHRCCSPLWGMSASCELSQSHLAHGVLWAPHLLLLQMPKTLCNLQEQGHELCIWCTLDQWGTADGRFLLPLPSGWWAVSTGSSSDNLWEDRSARQSNS